MGCEEVVGLLEEFAWSELLMRSHESAFEVRETGFLVTMFDDLNTRATQNGRSVLTYICLRYWDASAQQREN